MLSPDSNKIIVTNSKAIVRLLVSMSILSWGGGLMSKSVSKIFNSGVESSVDGTVSYSISYRSGPQKAALKIYRLVVSSSCLPLAEMEP